MLIGAVGCFTIAGLTGLALAKTSPTLGTAKNSTIGKTIVVDSRGLTVYELSPETTHHLLCTKAKGCFSFWPPVTVHSANTKLTTGSGVKGKLGILHRNGFFQLTLGGRPLYHFSGDQSKRGKATGQGLKSFGGSWHVVAASGTATTPPMTTTPTTPTTPYPSPY
jgi:predicted lipoprotein with Yx(FWY)xxD motif